MTPPTNPEPATEAGRRPIDGLWDALWEDLRHNATGRLSGLLIVTQHRYAIEAAARSEVIAGKSLPTADALWDELYIAVRHRHGNGSRMIAVRRAIEAAARAEALAEVRRGVEGLAGWRLATDGHSGWMTDTWTTTDDGGFLDRAAILALLPDPPK